jgi:hypothetical protein
MKAAYHCPICGREVGYEGRLPLLYPFCSERCRMVDLGRWLSEQYSIDRDVTPEDVAEPPHPSRAPDSND